MSVLYDALAASKVARLKDWCGTQCRGRSAHVLRDPSLYGFLDDDLVGPIDLAETHGDVLTR